MELKRLTTCLIAMAIVGPLMPAISAGPVKEADQSKLRVGVFDSRAVAAAWYRSKAHMKHISEMKAEHKKAEAAGDTKRAAELEKEGSGSQDLAHRQVFSNEPVVSESGLVGETLLIPTTNPVNFYQAISEPEKALGTKIVGKL